jgi:multiple sugar transport system substrate-binding protein
MDHWPALILLARAASYASHPQQEAVLFDPTSMTARIAEPPFARALEEWRQEAMMTAGSSPVGEGRPSVLAEFPASAQVYNRSKGDWEAVSSGPRQVPLLAGGTLLAVTSASRNAASAFELAAWLASEEIGRQLGPIGKGGFPVRSSMLDESARWIEAGSGRGDKSQIAGVVRSALTGDEALVVLRIPGTDEYLNALSAAVDQVLEGEASATDALGEAAAKWDMITSRLGREAQRSAYLNDLGIEEP